MHHTAQKEVQPKQKTKNLQQNNPLINSQARQRW